MNNKILVGALVILMLLVSGLYFSGSASFGATGTRFPNGLSADSTSPVAGEVRGTTLTITSAITAAAATLSGLFTANAGQIRSNPNATSTTATTQTLVQADIGYYDTMLLTLNTGDATITLPATSTLTTVVPTAGDRQDFCVHNATSTAGIDITWAAGAGIDLEVASSTITDGTPVLTTTSGNTGCFTLIRKTNTDILALFDRYVDGD